MILASESLLENTSDSLPLVTQTQETQQLSFPKGLIGFENYTQYSLSVFNDGPLYILDAEADENLFFYLINPYLVRNDYVLDISEEDLALLKKPNMQDIIVFAIVTIGTSLESTTCNLLGPLVINTKNEIALQCVNNGAKWTTKHTLSNGAVYSASL